MQLGAKSLARTAQGVPEPSENSLSQGFRRVPNEDEAGRGFFHQVRDREWSRINSCPSGVALEEQDQGSCPALIRKSMGRWNLGCGDVAELMIWELVRFCSESSGSSPHILVNAEERQLFPKPSHII